MNDFAAIFATVFADFIIIEPAQDVVYKRALRYHCLFVNTLDLIFRDNSGRLRSGWRAAIFLFAFIVISIVAGTIQQIVVSGNGSNRGTSSSFILGLNGLLLTMAAIFLGWGCGRIFEKVPFRSIGAYFSRGWLVHFISGCIAGSAALSFAVLIALAFGGERFRENTENDTRIILISLGISMLVFAAAAAFEEALFRGYLLQTFARSGLAWLAVAITSVFFGLVHLSNPNVTAISTTNTVLAGLMFSVSYLKTRDLWFVWGLHLMWNWMQGSFFGVEVSGLTSISAAPFLKEIDFGPAWLTGSSYGIEGGIACTITLILTTIAIWYFPFFRPDPELVVLTSPGFENAVLQRREILEAASMPPGS